MALTYSDKLEVQAQIWDGKALLDEQSFYNQRYGEVHMIGQMVHLFGANFPLALRTYGEDFAAMMITKGGVNAGTVEEIPDIQYAYPVVGQRDKAAVVAETPSSTTEVGKFNQPFNLVFTDNWIRDQALVVSPSRVQATVKKITQVSGGYQYTMVLDGDEDAYVPASDLTAGKAWVDIGVPVAQSESRGTEHKYVAPGKVKNQLNVIRNSFQWSGNTPDMILPYSIKVPNGSGGVDTVTGFIDEKMRDFEYKCFLDLETVLWYSQYNRRTNGQITNKDIMTGKVIPRGSGLLEQIVNSTTYTKLTYEKLQQWIGDALYGQPDQKGRKVTLYTGIGGMREIDRVLKERSLNLTANNATSNFMSGAAADKFVKGEGHNMKLDGYFNAFMHVDGYMVEVKRADVFDYGKYAMNAAKHPESGLPLESYRMVCLDDTSYDGVPNIKVMALKGMRFQHGIVKGLQSVPKSLSSLNSVSGGAPAEIATDKAIAGYHRLVTAGAQLMRANTSFHAECVYGL